MKKVIEKLKSENDRIRKLSGVSAGFNAAANQFDIDKADIKLDSKVDKKLLLQEKKRTEKLEEEIKVLTDKSKNYDDTLLKLTQRQQQIASLRKQIKSREDEQLALKQSYDLIVSENDNLLKKIKDYEDKILKLESSLQSVSSKLLDNNLNKNAVNNESKKQLMDIEKLKYKVDELQTLVKQRETELQKIQLEYNKKSNQKISEFTDLGVIGDKDVNYKTMKQLTEENNKLKQELSAFDMEFFDEIENLKYEHSEFLRKLRIYQRAYGDIA